MLDNKGFDLWADGYDRSVGLSDEDNTYPFAGYKKVLASIYDAIRAGQGKRVLDIGFGTGVLACRLYENGYDITGIDFSERMIQIAQEKMPFARLIQHDFTNGLPEDFQNQKFDAIVCTYAIHHLDDGAKITFLKELQTHLNPEGRIYIGDVAFVTRQALEECRAQCGDEWDDEEFYVVAEEILENVGEARFEQISHCAGVLMIRGLRGNKCCGFLKFLPITQDQRDTFHSLLTNYYRDGEDAQTPQEELDAFIALLFDLCKQDAISGCIAYLEDAVGFVLWGMDTEDFPFSNRPGFGTILEIGVVPSMRGSGLGKQLAEYAEKAMDCGRYYVCAYGPAEEFWIKCNYQDTGKIAKNGLKIFEKT